MKKSILLLLGIVISMAFVQAQNDVMYFMKDNVVINQQSIVLEDVDSIIFYNPNEGEVKFTVTFNANGENVTGLPESIVVVEGKSLTQPTPDPARSGNVFDGWYKEAGCVNVFNFNVDVITSDITLFAKWNVVLQSKVTFVVDYFYQFADQPIIDIKCDFVVEPVMADQGSPLSNSLIPSNLTAKGGDLQVYGKGLPFDFGGWTTDVMGIEDFDMVNTPIPDHDITLYAKWVMAPQFLLLGHDTILAEATGGGPWRDVAHVVVPSNIGEQAIHVIAPGAFWYLRNGPNTVVISEGITTLMTQAFTDSPGLIKITLPSTLTYIGSYCFVIGGTETSAFGPPKLREIIINATTPPVVGETWFWLETRDPGLVVKVPKGTLGVYQSAPGWETLYDNMIEQE